jgi:fluoroquinolone transport system ATP-binding protein
MTTSGAAPKIRDGSAAVIAVDALSYRYPRAQRDAVHDASFDVARGEIFGLLGPSGAGKSTTQNILTGLLPGYRGDARVFDRPVHAHGRELYERIGVSFEMPNVYGRLSGRENLAFFAALYRGPTTSPDALLALVGLEHDAGRGADQYSKGMRMRLNFCRALLRDPELLFLDEPTAGQDPENARRLKDIIRERRARGTTVLLTTHDMTLATELCDRVAFIVDGRIAALDSPRSLMVRHGRRRVRVEYRATRDAALQRAEFDLDGLGGNAEFLDLIARVEIETIHSLDATLEDVFIAVTGRGLQ